MGVTRCFQGGLGGLIWNGPNGCRVAASLITIIIIIINSWAGRRAYWLSYWLWVFTPDQPWQGPHKS